MREKPVLVTGASGYIGGRCATALVKNGYDVRWGTRRLTEALSRQNWVIYGDLGADDVDLTSAISGCGTVIHFAGHSNVTELLIASPLLSAPMFTVLSDWRVPVPRLASRG